MDTRNMKSFRGEPIPDIGISDREVRCVDASQVVNKINDMTPEQRKSVTIEAAHFSNHRLSAVRISTGDIISVETAIALAGNNMLYGYSTGATMNGKRTIRSKPSAEHSIYTLPKF